MTKPVTPNEVELEKPEFVIKTVNDLLKEKYSDGVARFTLRELKARIAVAAPDGVVQNGWADIEPLYRTYGWKVEFDRPAYNESYESRFIFRKK